MRWLKTAAMWGFGSLVALGILVAVGPRVDTDTTTQPVALEGDLDAMLKKQEARFVDMRPNTQKSIRWYHPTTKAQTPLSILFFHGFSASRMEVEPLCTKLAQALQANVFFTRLRGHGRSGDALAEGSVRAWAQDAREALQISRRIGKKVIIMGSSTGATLAVWLAAQPFAKDIFAHIWMSPNFGPRDKRADILLWPWGKQIATLIQGKRRRWEPSNEGQRKYWTYDYPIESLLPMMALVRLARDTDLRRHQTPTLIIYSQKDQVLDPRLIEARFPLLASKHKKLLPFNTSSDPSSHVLAGDILSPRTTQPLFDATMAFLAPLLPKRSVVPTPTPTPKILSHRPASPKIKPLLGRLLWTLVCQRRSLSFAP